MGGTGGCQAGEAVSNNDSFRVLESETLLKPEPRKDFSDQCFTPRFTATHFTIAGIVGSVQIKTAVTGGIARAAIRLSRSIGGTP